MKTEFIEKIRQIGKDYYTLKDLAKIWKLKKESLKVTCSRMVRKKLLLRIEKNIYILPEKFAYIDRIANQIYSPSYLSFESALSWWGVLSQAPYSLTFASSKRSKKISIGKVEIVYRHLKDDLFFGFENRNNLFIAEPEKAFLDLAYFVSFGRENVNLKNLAVEKLNKKKTIIYLEKYPPKTINLVENILKAK